MKRNTLQQALILLTAVYSLSSCATHTTSLASTFWRYTDADLTYELLLKPDGHIYSYHPGDASPEDDYWKQKGKKITLKMNDSYAVYKGKLINDSTITGIGRSKGFRWKWNAKFVANN